MSDVHTSITTWLEQLKRGDSEAAARLWDCYLRRLLGLARARLAPLRRQATADEEDVALSAFFDFCRAVRAAGYAGLRGRDDLWRVLAAFVVNKAKALVDRERAAKRGGGPVRGDSAFGSADERSSGPQGFDRVESREADPALAAEVAEKFARFFAGLGEQEAEIAGLRMEGHSTEEIAERVGFAPATVRRRLAVIRDVLAKEFGSRGDGG
jgi:DNA-directed RNA polymerase specialized sigma24 family protein